MKTKGYQNVGHFCIGSKEENICILPHLHIASSNNEQRTNGHRQLKDPVLVRFVNIGAIC